MKQTTAQPYLRQPNLKVRKFVNLFRKPRHRVLEKNFFRANSFPGWVEWRRRKKKGSYGFIPEQNKKKSRACITPPPLPRVIIIPHRLQKVGRTKSLPSSSRYLALLSSLAACAEMKSVAQEALGNNRPFSFALLPQFVAKNLDFLSPRTIAALIFSSKHGFRKVSPNLARSVGALITIYNFVHRPNEPNKTTPLLYTELKIEVYREKFVNAHLCNHLLFLSLRIVPPRFILHPPPVLFFLGY